MVIFPTVEVAIRFTITINVPCPQQSWLSTELYYFQLDSAMQGAKVYVWCDSAKKFIEIDGTAGDDGNNYFGIARYSFYDEPIKYRERQRLLKLVYNGAEYFVKLTFGSFANSIFTANPNIKGSPTMNIGNMIVKDGEEITITLPEIEEGCEYRLHYDSLHFTDSIPKRILTGGELTFSLAEGICFASIVLERICECPEKLILHFYNQDSLIPPDVTVIGNCAGGAILTANDVNNCAGLKMRWVDEDGNIIDRTSENSNSAKVDSAGRYRAEYYYPSDPKNPIYSADTTITATDLFTPIFEVVYTNTSRHDLGDEWRCYFSARVKILLPDANASKYRYNVLIGSENEDGGLEWEEAKWGADISFSKRDSSYYLGIYEEIDCDTREFKITVLDDDEPLCELLLIADCECDSCEALKRLFAVQVDYIQGSSQVGKEPPFYKILFGPQNIDNLDSCLYRIRIPKNIEIIGMKREDGSTFPHNSYIRNELDTVSNTGEYFDFFQYTMFPPCDSVMPNPNIKPIRREVFYITYKNSAGEICDSLRISLGCRCDEPKKWWLVSRGSFPGGDFGGGIGVDYCVANYTSATPPTTTLINSYIYDNFGNRITTVYTLNPGSTPCGTFSFVMPQGYPSGIYHITLETDEEVLGDTTFFYTK